MVLTRRQERLLMRQYHGESAEIVDGELFGSPATPRTSRRLSNGQELKSALKTHTRARPWESEEDGNDATPAGAGIKKTVRIRSKDNMIHVFEKESSLSMPSRGLAFDDDDADDAGIHTTAKIKPAKGAMASLSATKAIGAVLALLAWAISSTWLIFLNRDIMRFRGFPYPLMLPALSQLGSAAIAWGVGAAGLVPVRPWCPREFASRQAPLVAAAMASMFLGNYAYLRLSVAFLNILKALMPAVTLALGAAAGTERFTGAAFASTLLIAYGTGVATVQEIDSAGFHWLSFLSFVASLLFEGIRVVLAARLLGGMARPYNPVEMLAHLGPAVFVAMATASVVSEQDVLSATLNQNLAADLILVSILSFVVNVSSFYAISMTSSTTFKVFGCFRNVGVVVAGAMLGDLVTRRQWEGYALSTAGFLLYTWAKGQPDARARAQAKAVAGGPRGKGKKTS